jgi:SAM-dependent methyltransferase
MAVDDGLQRCWAGLQLHGDDFTPEQIEAWHADEQEAYAELKARDPAGQRYAYHALNGFHGFRFLPQGPFQHVLGFGSAAGHELLPLAGRIRRLTIVEPSGACDARQVLRDVPTETLRPAADGTLAFPSGTFDLVTCLGVLHHIPNVSHVLGELHRCLHPRGLALVREPIVSLGDWRRARPGLTKRERGIPLGIFREMIERTGFVVRHERFCVFRGLALLGQKLGSLPYNNLLLTRLDHVCARLLRWNLRYHATTRLGKLRPTSVYYVLARRP